MIRTENIDKISVALCAAQSELHNPPTNQTASIPTSKGKYEFSYADLPSILDLIRPVLAKNGLSLVQTMFQAGETMALRTTLLHVSGQFIESEWVFPKGLRTMEMGGDITYARRYSIVSMLGIISDQDKSEDFFSNFDTGKKAGAKTGTMNDMAVNKAPIITPKGK